MSSVLGSRSEKLSSMDRIMVAGVAVLPSESMMACNVLLSENWVSNWLLSVALWVGLVTTMDRLSPAGCGILQLPIV